MKLRVVFSFTAALLMAAVLIAPMLTATATVPGSPSAEGLAQADATATPTDPAWLGFVTARQALSEELGRSITIVQRWQFVQREFPTGINEGCRTLQEGEEAPEEYVGWSYIITLLNGERYEIRVSFNLLAALVCDEVTTGLFGDGPDDGTIPSDIGTVAEGPLEVGAQVPNSFGTAESEYLSQANMTWVKFQARPGTDFSGLISSAKSAGFKVLTSVIGNHDLALDPDYQQTYIDYLVALANDGADAIEVWNEVNLEREWPQGTDGNIDDYVALLEKANAAIKAANPNVIVISAGPAPTGAFGTANCAAAGCNDDYWYQQAAQAGMAAHADCIGVHYNEGIISPTRSSGDPRDNFPTRYFGANLNRAMANFPGMPACFTEIGYLSPEGYPPLPGEFAWAQNTSVTEQATWLGEAVVLASQLGNVRMLIVFNLNFSGYVGNDPQGGYAMVRPDGSCPACETIASVIGG